MNSFRWILLVFSLSLGLHLGIFAALHSFSPEKKEEKKWKKIKFKVLRPTPAQKKPEMKPPQKKPEPPKPPKPKKLKPKPKKLAKKAPPPPNQTVSQKAIPPKEPVKPIFGVTQSSLSKTGKGNVVVQQGNTLMTEPTNPFVKPSDIKPYVGPTQPLNPPVKNPDRFSPIPEYEVDSNPIEKSRAKAYYPEEAKSENIQATVILSLEIRKNGTVRKAKVVSVRPKSAENYSFGTSARKALLQYRFEPAKYKGKPVDVVIRYVYKFVLDD